MPGEELLREDRRGVVQPGRWSASRPYSASIQHPALYMGFLPLGTDPEKGPDADPVKDKVAFPANTSIELYFGLEVTNDERKYPKLKWEYWNGQGWQALGKMTRRGTFAPGSVGFFGPSDHKHSLEFGHDAYWFAFALQTLSQTTAATKIAPPGPSAPAMPPCRHPAEHRARQQR